MMTADSREYGFTLIEILVALAVVTLVLTAAGGAAGLAVRTQQALRDQTLAHWVASNVMTEFRLAEDWVEVDAHEGDAQMAGRTWHWRALVSSTEVDSLRRIEIEVWPQQPSDPVSPSARLIGFVGRERSRSPVGLWASAALAADPEQAGQP